LLELYAALKRRSSTVLPAATGLRASATTGAEAQRELLELYAALKRRSSTALPAATGLRASATTGLKPSASCWSFTRR